MRPYIAVDASVAGAWLFAETYSAQSQRVLLALNNNTVEAIVPDRFFEEVLRICQKKLAPPPLGAGILPVDGWSRFLDVASHPLLYPIPSDELHHRAWDICMLYPGLTTHDGLYIAAAELWTAELWTLDDRMGGCSKTIYAHVHDLRSEPFPY